MHTTKTLNMKILTNKMLNNIKFIFFPLTVLLSTYSSHLFSAESPYAGIALPGVPIEVTDPVKSKAVQTKIIEKRKVAKLPLNTFKKNNTKKTFKTRSFTSNQSVSLKVKPGINQIIPVAVGHLNRIVTPFDNPQVKTVSTVSTEVIGNIIYVATSDKNYSSMFITNEDDDIAISLTLQPKAIPPRDIKLSIDTLYAPSNAFYPSAKAKRWEESSSYIDTIKSALTMTAKGKTPPGYTLRRPVIEDVRTECTQEGLSLTLGQVLDGYNIYIQIYTLENTNSHTVEFIETSCYTPSVVAVSSWPHTIIQPGQSTELYIAYSRIIDEKNRITRPSLLGK